MKTAFVVIALIMTGAALAALLVPLIRNGRRTRQSRKVFALSITIVFLLPLTAAGLYMLVGTPVALNGIPLLANQPQMSMDQALAQLRAHLAAQPNDQQGWMLLGQASSASHDANTARDAYDHVLKLDPNNADAKIAWAEADALTRQDHQFQDHGLDLLKQAVQSHPNNQRGLWLLGIAYFQRDQFQDASTTWRQLQPLLEPGSAVAKAVAEQLATADARLNSAPASASSSASPSSSEPPAGATQDAGLQVQVSLLPALKEKLSKGDTLFVYALMEKGPPMPVAVAKLEAANLPLSITLTDAMAMMPQMKLSSATRVFVGARISHSGKPLPQPGDLEGDAGVVDVGRKSPVQIRIDKVHG